MHLIIPFLPDGAIHLEALSTLSTDFEHELYQEKHRLRHPIGIYNTSTERIAKRFNDVLDQLDRVLSEKKFAERSGVWCEELLKTQESLLFSIAEHIDNCSNILLCFFCDSSECNRNEHVRNFKSNIEPYRKHIGKIVNKIKHENSALREIIFYWQFDLRHAFPGYFLESAIGNNTIGPDPHVHTGGLTAFSFARDLRFHLVHFFSISRALANALKAIIQLSKADIPGKGNIAIGSVTRRITNLSPIYFPDEARKLNPWLRLTSGEQNIKLHVTLGAASPQAQPIESLKIPSLTITTRYVGDSVTTNFRVPYPKDLKRAV